MIAKVFVTLKSGVLDPQGSAIQHSVELMGIEGVSGIRQGKYFELAFADSVGEQAASETAERIAKDILANPVIEDYKVELITDN